MKVTAPIVSASSPPALRTYRAELSKLVSLPATWLAVGSTWGVTVTLVLVHVAATRQEPTTPVSSLDVGLTVVNYAQIGPLVLGALTATSEHVGGQLRTTLVATPWRTRQRMAATAALVTVTVPAVTGILASSVGVAHVGIGTLAETVDVGHTAGVVLRLGTFLGVLAVIGSVVGVLARGSLATVSILLGYVLILGPMARDHAPNLARFLPDTAGLSFVPTENAGIEPALAWTVMLVWATGAVAVSLLIYRRRDVT